MKTLIIYYSRTGKTDLVARTIAGEIGADLRRVEDYADRPLLFDYIFGSFLALRGKGSRIREIDHGLKGYDQVLIGSPVWAGNCAPPITEFCAGADFSGCAVIPFATLGGKNVGVALKSLSAMVARQGGRVIGSFSLPTGFPDPEIEAYAREIARKLK